MASLAGSRSRQPFNSTNTRPEANRTERPAPSTVSWSYPFYAFSKAIVIYLSTCTYSFRYLNYNSSCNIQLLDVGSLISTKALLALGLK